MKTEDQTLAWVIALFEDPGPYLARRWSGTYAHRTRFLFFKPKARHKEEA